MPHPPATLADRRFRAIHAREWAWRRREFAGADAEDDAALPADHLPRVDPAAQAARSTRWQATLAALDRLDAAALGAENRISLAVYRQQIASLLADQQFRAWEMPLTSDGACWLDLRLTAQLPLASAEDAERYLAWLGDICRYLDAQTANLRAGLARGFTPPAITLAGHPTALAAVADAPGARNPFHAPLQHLPAGISTAAQTRLQRTAAQLIDASVRPAHARLLAFLRSDYLPHARHTLAASALPDGAAYYRAQIRKFTTLDLSPELIHELGREEVAKLHQAMAKTIRTTGFKGDFAAFQRHLHSDPAFHAPSADALLKEAAWIVNRINGVIGRYIGRLPRQRFAISPVPDELAPHYTSGRGGAGYYLLNTYDLPSRPLYALPALTLHEATPGHALQMPLAAEREDLPAFRRNAPIAAYCEGWALYAERLGVEMGIYRTPWEHFGYLGFQMWRACRLVVDTGLHHYGWSREKACAYLREHTTLAELEINTEVDRYIAWPGQALAYYLGEMAIIKVRERAERALGKAFDLRAFHDAVLAPGAVPLAVLETVVDAFIADDGRSPWATTVKRRGM